MSAMTPPSGRFEGPLHVLPVRVYYEDTDAAGIVYYANYLRFIERARTEMMRRFGLDHTAMAGQDGIAFAVRRIEGDYLSPARLDDALDIHSEVRAIKGASLIMAQAVVRPGPDGPATLARFSLTLACMTLADGRPARLPADLRRRLRDFAAAAPLTQPNT
ncbi:tol-pal system-associated acyl-CoA thioesterase [Roseospirillum parvum]|uniref:Acyl-CoA thioester hydrolase n=1 Tax=Roseospirillum parvum TaxID=83401 RepID=A0A1G7XNF9_9PROT|nr:tol-pal system-associated acyl-CoA thioesterase [Roseospirillum parvum]SDG85596.1 acyl-CoA thioester hydrolase [Roseospirillum parvum]